MPTILPQTSGIYRITCTANGKFYIGSAVNLKLRWKDHRTALRGNRHVNRYLQHAWNKYGESAFTIEVLELVMPWSLLDCEQYWLDKFKPYKHDIGFNIAKNAEASGLGRKHTPETKAKISKAHMGMKASPEALTNMSAAKKGANLAPETVEKIRQGNKGKVRSPEMRAQISATLMGHPGWMKGKKLTPEQVEKATAPKRGRYVVTTPEGIEVKVWGLAGFCREHGLSQGHMSMVAQGKRKHHKGWICRHDTEDKQ